ncbi:helix-turn-helix transcriptional regulator [Mycobacterium sp. SMC-4]|uniref:ArsR/SmtB family transcription factor n=1 Tax=Mycobacterium sp. SMC-4 TaxID=2857059 RepID=UPI0021B36F49|nr:metalloregulator ArsR/SmtB family transcription factor [Mycobacterium sp. SMC-4]UXA19179.1 metalloregulator ArsR/SmtB family transcription factor [Mycobacterium sp. SMC-4]
MPDDPAALDDPLPPRLLQDTAALFALLSATVRLHLLWLLASGERDVGTLADGTGQTVATVSHHLGKLKLAGLVESRRHGKRQVYVASDPHVLQIIRAAVEPALQQAPARKRARRA